MTGWKWHPEPVGVCRRCYWPANTLGEDSKPWHAFCWNNEMPPTTWDQWMLRVWREEQAL